MAKKALIILADGFEEVEAITPIDILRRTNIDVRIASLNPESLTVIGAHDIKIQADWTLENIQKDFDALILPGGAPGASNLAASETVRSIVKTMYSENKLIAAICAAPALVLSQTSILDGKKATCFPGMENHFSKTTTAVKDTVVVDGNIITSRGAGTAMAFSLSIIKELLGQDASESLRKKVVAS